MRISRALPPALLTTTTTAALLPFLHHLNQPQHALLSPQPPAMPATPGLQLPPTPDAPPAPPTGDVILSDVVGNTRAVSIFAGFTRSVASIAERLDDAKLNTTVLAPSNSAIQALPRKPWEDPTEYAELGTNAYVGAGGEERAQGNLRRFAEAHVVGASPWGEGERVKTVGEEGREVWWEVRDGRTVVMPGEVEVERVVSRVANGQVWVLKGVLNYKR